MKTGFIGLGIMGSRMARNLIQGGHEVFLYNRSISKAKSVAEQGGTLCRTIKEVAVNSEIVFTMVSTPGAVEDVALGGDDGLLHHLKEGRLWVNSSTVHPSFTMKMAEEASKRGISFLDAPVAGSMNPAQQGELVFLIGGDEKNVRKAGPLLDLLGKKNIVAGPVPSGSALKMVVNLLLGHSFAAFAEACSLGQSLGLDKEFLLDILPGLPVTAPFISAKTDKLRENNFDAEFPLQWMHKDLTLAAWSAYENDVSLPVTNAVKELYALAKRYGLGEKDMIALWELLEKRH